MKKTEFDNIIKENLNLNKNYLGKHHMTVTTQKKHSKSLRQI